VTHMTPGGESRPAPPLLSPTSPPDMADTLGIDRTRLRDALAVRRARAAVIETEWVALCERDAARGTPRGIRVDDRATWDKAMWNRYLAAAAASEPRFLPRLRRLHDEIARLEALLAPLSAHAAKAA
jgi:hypothetical protein